MKLFARKKKIDLSRLERQLASTLTPVAPRRDFVDDLRSRLMAFTPQTTPALAVESERAVPRKWIVAGGVAGSLLMLIVSIRGLLSIAGLFRLFVENRRSPASQPVH